MDSPNKPSKLTTVAPATERLPAGFGQEGKRGRMEEVAEHRKAPSAAHNGPSSAKPNPDYSMKQEQRLNSAGSSAVRAMSDVPTVSHALSGSLKVTDRKVGRR